jgi:predicted transcriptional regulator
MKQPTPIPITEAESTVMAVLWAASPLAAEDIVSALAGQQDWQEATIKTLLNRLLKKGAIAAQADGRRYLYTPLLARDDWLHSLSAGLLDRLFDGQVAPLVAHFGRHRRLSPQDIEDLKRLIQQMEDGPVQP